jgi:hypothetical protein
MVDPGHENPPCQDVSFLDWIMPTLRSSDNREPTYLSEPGLRGVSSPLSLIGAESDQLSALLWQGVLVLALVAVLTQ